MRNACPSQRADSTSGPDRQNALHPARAQQRREPRLAPVERRRWDAVRTAEAVHRLLHRAHLLLLEHLEAEPFVRVALGVRRGFRVDGQDELLVELAERAYDSSALGDDGGLVVPERVGDATRVLCAGGGGEDGEE